MYGCTTISIWSAEKFLCILIHQYVFSKDEGLDIVIVGFNHSSLKLANQHAFAKSISILNISQSNEY
jgi:hypothetical protein